MSEQAKTDPQGKPQQGQQAQQPQFPTDYSNLSTIYTNFCHVSLTPEELVLDFGLNPHFGPNPPSDPIKVTHRVVMNFFTAKRMLLALQAVVSQHERMFGNLELDLNKRSQNARGGAAPGGVPNLPRPPQG